MFTKEHEEMMDNINNRSSHFMLALHDLNRFYFFPVILTKVQISAKHNEYLSNTERFFVWKTVIILLNWNKDLKTNIIYPLQDQPSQKKRIFRNSKFNFHVLILFSPFIIRQIWHNHLLLSRNYLSPFNNPRCNERLR